MKKKLFLATLLVFAFVCLFAFSVSAAEIDYTETVTLDDKTVLPLYDENKESLIWFIVGTDENGANIYKSVAVNDNTKDDATTYITYNITSTYGTNQMHDLNINYWDEDAGAYVSYGRDNSESRVVVMNLRTLEREYWSTGAGWSSANLEYVYHSATVRSPGQFAGFTKLKVVDCSLSTNFTGFAQQGFKNCTSLKVVKIGDSQDGYALDGPQYGCLFQGCQSLERIEIADPSDVTAIGGNAFENCYNLTMDYTFTNVTTIGGGAFKKASTTEGCYLRLSFPNLVTLGGTSGDPHCFSYSGLEEIYIGNKLKYTGFQTFSSCKKLWKAEFAGPVAEGFNFKSYLFEDCTALKAFSIPEGITVLPSRMFKNCTSLTAVYLPSTLTGIESGSGEHSTFFSCKQMYFVSKSFTFTGDSDIPARGDVYYFPSNLANMSTGEVFKNCQGLNQTLVFGTKVTAIPNGWAFEAGTNSPTLQNIVFLGDMTEINVSSWRLTGTIYFANAKDLSSADVTITGSKTFVYCYAEGNSNHLLKETLTTDATCTNPAMTASYCFCGQIIGTPVIIDGSAPLGHNNVLVSFVFTNGFEAAGTFGYVCQRCECETSEETAPLLIARGYSATEATSNLKAAISSGYQLDTNLLSKYEEINGTVLNIGFALTAVTEAIKDMEALTLADFKIVAPLKSEGGEFVYKSLEYKLNYGSNTYMDREIIICAYVTEGETTKLIQSTDDSAPSIVAGLKTVSYYYLMPSAKPEVVE